MNTLLRGPSRRRSCSIGNSGIRVKTVTGLRQYCQPAGRIGRTNQSHREVQVFLTAPLGRPLVSSNRLRVSHLSRNHLCLIFEIMGSILETVLQSGSKRASLTQSIKSCLGLKVMVVYCKYNKKMQTLGKPSLCLLYYVCALFDLM